MDPLTRALRLTWAIDDAAADEVVRIDEGTLLRAPSVPDAWSVNALRLEHPQPGLTLAAVETLADRHARTPYRHVLVEDEATALRLVAEAEAAGGWKVEVEVLMRLAAAPAPAGRGAGAVREGELDEVLELLHVWLTEEGHPPDTVDQIVARSRREHALMPELLLVADHLGAPAAMTTVRLAGDLAQVEDVYTVPDVRGAGLGRALVAEATHRAHASGAGIVFVVADDRDWPQRLYAKLGFVAMGRRAQLHRPA